VVSCYEAGAGGFVLHRQLAELGVKNLVVAPRKLDPNQRGVQTDKTDARDLAMDLDRYVRGNDKALRVVFVPSPEQEQRRAQSRQRRQLQQKRLALAAQGRSLLLSQGWRESNRWWKPRRWTKLQEILPRWLRDMLEVWWRGECRQTRQKAFAYNMLAAFRKVTGIVVSPWVNIVLQKTPHS